MRLFYTTEDIRIRLRDLDQYYPNVAGILLDGAERTGYLGAHMEKDGLPPEPVFALWEDFDVLPALRKLDSLQVAAR